MLKSKLDLKAFQWEQPKAPEPAAPTPLFSKQQRLDYFAAVGDWGERETHRVPTPVALRSAGRALRSINGRFWLDLFTAECVGTFMVGERGQMLRSDCFAVWALSEAEKGKTGDVLPALKALRGFDGSTPFTSPQFTAIESLSIICHRAWWYASGERDLPESPLMRQTDLRECCGGIVPGMSKAQISKGCGGKLTRSDERKNGRTYFRFRHLDRQREILDCVVRAAKKTKEFRFIQKGESFI